MDAITEFLLDYMDTKPQMLRDAARTAQYGIGDTDANVRQVITAYVTDSTLIQQPRSAAPMQMLLGRVDWPTVTRRLMYHEFDDDIATHEEAR